MVVESMVTMKYRPDLDGIRAVAVLAVLASHTGEPLAAGGWMGVDVFFVLSGYLITALLLAEQQSNNRIQLGRFYARRGLRLYPALVTLLLLGFCFYPILGQGETLSGYVKTAAITATYMQDFAIGISSRFPVGFPHTWSLAVEEQFYLIWPPVLILLLKFRRGLLSWAVAGALLSWGLMILSLRPPGVGDTPYASYYLPWNRFSQLMVGCCVAIYLARRSVPKILAHPWVGWAAAAACVGLMMAAARFKPYPNMSWEAPAIAIAVAVLLFQLENGPSRLRRWLGCKPLAYIGRRSYGIYLYHLPILLILTHYVHVRRPEMALIMLVTTILVAIASYRFIELPFLRLKSKLRAPVSGQDQLPDSA